MIWSTPSTSSPLLRDRLLFAGLVLAAGVCTGVLLLIIAFVVLESWPAFQNIGLGSFLRDSAWRPTSGEFGLAPIIAGSLAVTLGSAVLTIPIGVAAAVYLRVYAPAWIALVYRRVIELLAGIPSVVYGFWGLVVLVPIIAEVAPSGSGHSLLAGILVLTLMTLPIVALTTDAALAQVPPDQLRAAAALGLSRWTMVRHVLLPQSAGGIVTGSLLQLGRAIGETMAVLMVCGNVVELPDSIFAPVRTLTANIALEMGYAGAQHRNALFVCGFILLFAVMGLVLGAHRLERRWMSA